MVSIYRNVVSLYVASHKAFPNSYGAGLVCVLWPFVSFPTFTKEKKSWRLKAPCDLEAIKLQSITAAPLILLGRRMSCYPLSTSCLLLTLRFGILHGNFSLAERPGARGGAYCHVCHAHALLVVITHCQTEQNQLTSSLWFES